MAHPSTAYCAVELRSRPSLGSTRLAGLSATHHFCFAGYQRPDRIEWGGLRAVNEYRLAAGAVREPTFHSGFEILTLVEEGWLARLGTHEVLRPLHPGAAELISCGVGANLGVAAVGNSPVSYLEIWIRSAAVGRSRRQWRPAMPEGIDRPLASGPLRSGRSLRWHVDASVARVALEPGRRVERMLAADDCVYLAVRSGALEANGVEASAGDGIAASGPGLLSVRACASSELAWIRTSDGAKKTLSM